QRAPYFGIAFRNGVEQSPANESRAEDGLTVSVVRIAALRPHHAAGRRATPCVLLVAAATYIEGAARREETVERRDQLRARQPILGIRCHLQPLSFSAGAADAKREFALVAGFAEFAEADQLISMLGPCAARLADCLRHFYRLISKVSDAQMIAPRLSKLKL